MKKKLTIEELKQKEREELSSGLKKSKVIDKRTRKIVKNE